MVAKPKSTTPTRLKVTLVSGGWVAYEVGRAAGLTDTKMTALSVGRILPTLGEAKALAKVLKLKVTDLFDQFSDGDGRRRKKTAEAV
jgi:DNA-binding XRE family transcriptional regulator